MHAKASFNVEIPKVKSSMFVFLFSTRYFFLSVQGTYGKSLIIKAQKIDKLPTDIRNQEIQSWRNKQRPTPVPQGIQPSQHLLPPVTDQSFRTSTTKNSSPHKQKHVEDWVLHGDRDSRLHMTDDLCSRDSSAKFSSGEHLLGSDRTTAAEAYISGQTNRARTPSRSSHRRSQSSLTIWRDWRHLYKLRRGHPITGLSNPEWFLFKEERMC